jgi:ring-1,2-phenylacetyl-CoA epoxidase subunit PaaA
MAEVVPFMDEVGLDVPAHWDEAEQRWIIDCPFPAAFDSDRKQSLLDGGPISCE